MDQLLDRKSDPPPGHFKIGLYRKVGYIAETQVGQYGDRSGDTEHLLQRRMIQDAHPSHSDPLSTGREPQILNRAAGAVEIGVAHGRAPQDMSAAPLASARDTEIHRRLLDPFQLETSIEAGSGSCVSGRRFGIDFVKQRPDRPLRGHFFDHHKIPGLHEPDRAGMVRSGQQSRQYVVGNRRRKKVPPDIPAFENCPVHRLPLWFRKLAVAARQLFHSFTSSADPLA